MKFVVNVYEDYDASKIVADGVVGFDTQDWGDLITSVLNNKRIDVKKVKGVSVDVMGVVCVDGLYELPDNPAYLTVRIKDVDNAEILAEFAGIDAENVEGQTDKVRELNKTTWRKFLTMAEGYDYGQIIINYLKKRERLEIKEIKDKTSREIEEIQSIKKDCVVE